MHKFRKNKHKNKHEKRNQRKYNLFQHRKLWYENILGKPHLSCVSTSKSTKHDAN